jgi:hypothetical protein
MKAAWSMFSGLAVVCFLALGVHADDKDKKNDKAKEETLTGKLVCPKCALKDKDYKECGNALQVTGKDGKTVTTYYLDDKGRAEKYHACTTPKENVTVVGTVSEKGGKKMIKVTKVETDAKKDDKKGS